MGKAMKFQKAISNVEIVKNFVHCTCKLYGVKSHENLASQRGTNEQQRISKSP